MIKRQFCVYLLSVGLMMTSACNQTNNERKPPMPNVKTALAEQRDIPIYIDTIGQAISQVTVNIRPQVNGKLVKAYFEQGAIVNEGDILYEIDPRPYQATFDQAIAQLQHDEALLKYAEQAVTRNKRVVEEDFISKINFEQYQSNEAAAKAQVDLDKASIRSAEINVEFTKVVAPVSGKISFSNVDVGNILVIDDPNQITVIRPFTPIDIQFSLPQEQFEMIRVEQGNEGKWPFIATLPEKPEHLFEGVSYFIDNQINQNTGTILLKGTLPNRERELWPGEFIRVKVLYKVAQNAITVPPGAVLMGRNGPYLYKIDAEGKAQVQNVTVLTRSEDYIALAAEGLQAGDKIIIDGQINVAPGLVVNDVTIKKE